MIFKLLCSGFGIGYIRKGGGSVAAAVTVLLMLWASPRAYMYSPVIYVAVTGLLIGIGTWASYQVEQDWGKDSYRVVIDEIAGMWISMLWVPVNWKNLLAAFILFRFFDIAKPLFIRKLEGLPGGLGVMADDILAGIYALIVMQICLTFNLLTR
jgi:phosphatidylglycerophosphatase A